MGKTFVNTHEPPKRDRFLNNDFKSSTGFGVRQYKPRFIESLGQLPSFPGSENGNTSTAGRIIQMVPKNIVPIDKKAVSPLTWKSNEPKVTDTDNNQNLFDLIASQQLDTDTLQTGLQNPVAQETQTATVVSLIKDNKNLPLIIGLAILLFILLLAILKK